MKFDKASSYVEVPYFTSLYILPPTSPMKCRQVLVLLSKGRYHSPLTSIGIHIGLLLSVRMYYIPHGFSIS